MQAGATMTTQLVIPWGLGKSTATLLCFKNADLSANAFDRASTVLDAELS
jgi:hypothetical protein